MSSSSQGAQDAGPLGARQQQERPGHQRHGHLRQGQHPIEAGKTFSDQGQQAHEKKGGKTHGQDPAGGDRRPVQHRFEEGPQHPGDQGDEA